MSTKKAETKPKQIFSAISAKLVSNNKIKSAQKVLYHKERSKGALGPNRQAKKVLFSLQRKLIDEEQPLITTFE